jgi:lambda repressor-like predicted transcriptional regulator
MGKKLTIAERIYRNADSAMARAGLTNKEIAKIAGCSATQVSYVKTSRRKGYRVRQIIADECGVPYSEIWIDETDSSLPKAA